MSSRTGFVRGVMGGSSPALKTIELSVLRVGMYEFWGRSRYFGPMLRSVAPLWRRPGARIAMIDKPPPGRESGRTTVTREEAVWAIRKGYTPRYVELCKVKVRRTGKKLNKLFPPEEAGWIQALAIHWGLTEGNSHD